MLGHTGPFRRRLQPRTASCGLGELPDRTLRLWTVGTKGGAARFGKNTSGRVLALSFSPQGTVLASGDTKERLLLWDVARRQPTLLGPGTWARCVAWPSPRTARRWPRRYG